MKNLSLPFLLLCITSCATYNQNKIGFNNQKLVKCQLQILEGLYRITPKHEYGYHGFIVEDSITQEPILPNYLHLGSVVSEDGQKTFLEIKVVDHEHLKFLLLRENQVVDSIKIRGVLKDNGMFHFKDNTSSSQGIPGLAGSIQHSKTRLGLTKNGDLLVQYAYSQYGAFLMIFGDGRGGNDTYSFERIIEKSLSK